MLPRILEPEVMDTAEDARDYDAMDHAAVNRLFIQDLIQFIGNFPTKILDVGTGTALIPVELCRTAAGFTIHAVDAAKEMLLLAERHIDAAQLGNRIVPVLADAKQLPFGAGSFGAVISNSIVHHIPEPFAVLQEIVRMTAPGGAIFVRDLMRPVDLTTLRHLVDTYATDANPHQQQLFADSLHAALTVEEMRELVHRLGFPPDSVNATSDRHWTWAARRS